jgi:hypothetical protein
MKNSMFITLIICVLSFSVSFQNVIQAQCTADHSELKNWYNNNQGSTWGVNWGQNINDATMQNWEGITLNSSGCVQKIDLQGKSLKGTLPNFNLPSLTSLFLYGGEITGALPPLTACASLTQLVIVQQKISGTIPNFTQPKLAELSLEGNALTGTIPNTFPTSLTTLFLSNNKLSGEIPNFDLPNLIKFSAATNLLTGALPSFVSCKQLESISLSGNKIISLPNLLILSKLGILDLSKNQLSGTIPTLNFPKLTRLDLSKNKFIGSVPSFEKNPALTFLKLAENQLSGEIPKFNLPALRDLDLSFNLLTGAVPNFSLPELGGLYLNNNQLSGNLPNFALPNLVYCNLSINQITGNLPPWNLLKLNNLNLNDNQITGNLPVMTLPNLTSLSAMKNKITGGLENLDTPKMFELILDDNQIAGQIPALKAPNLYRLSLANNKINGIAADLTLTKLNSIYLGKNNLTGLFPQLSFPLLTIFDASNNQLDSCVKNFPTYPKLKRTNVLGNKLTFDDLLRTDMTFYEFYAPQDSCGKVLVLTTMLGANVTIPCGIDNGIATNTYKWSKLNDANFSQTGRNLVFTNFQTSNAGSYFCEIKNPGAANLTLSRRLVKIISTPLFSYTKVDNICSADKSGSILIAASGGTAPYSFQWTKNGILLSDKTQTINNLANAKYSVTVTDNKGISDTTSIIIASAKNTPKPVIAENNAVLSTSVSGQYQWFLNGKAITNATQSSYKPTQNGTYSVSVTDNACGAMSSNYEFKSIATEESIINTFNVFPNPISQNIYIQSNNNQLISKLTLKNSIGQIILAKAIKTPSENETLDVSSISEGSYFLEIYQEKEGLLKVVKIVK